MSRARKGAIRKSVHGRSDWTVFVEDANCTEGERFAGSYPSRAKALAVAQDHAGRGIVWVSCITDIIRPTTEHIVRSYAATIGKK